MHRRRWNAGSAIVLADGGDPTLIHACRTATTTGPNLIMVNADQGCPGGSTPVHWPAAVPPEVTAPPELPPGSTGTGKAGA